jgi:hypothetical protein
MIGAGNTVVIVWQWTFYSFSLAVDSPMKR